VDRRSEAAVTAFVAGEAGAAVRLVVDVLAVAENLSRKLSYSSTTVGIAQNIVEAHLQCHAIFSKPLLSPYRCCSLCGEWGSSTPEVTDQPTMEAMAIHRPESPEQHIMHVVQHSLAFIVSD